VTFKVTITSGSGIPTGNVTFKDGSTPIGTVPLAGNLAVLTTSAFAVGTHVITAVYSGNAAFAASTSAPLVQAISVPVDSEKLRKLQIAATTVVAQNSGQALSSAIDSAISEGFSDSQQLIAPTSTGLRFNFTADSAAAAPPEARSRFDDAFAAFGPPGGRDFPAEQPGTPQRRIDDALAALAGSGRLTKAPAPRPEPRQWLAWADVQITGVAHWGAASTPTLYGSQVNALLGLTGKVTSNFLIGVLGGYETFDYRSDALVGRLKGDGWTVGSYLGAKLGPGVRFDVAAAYSGVSYDGVAGAASGKFNGNRWLLSGGLTGSYQVSGIEIEPSAKIFGLWEHENAYTDSLGTLQSERTFTTGRASGGVKLIYPLAWGSGTVVAPYVGVYADYYFTGDNAAVTAGVSTGAPALLPFLSGWSARAAGGLAARFENGAAISFGGEFGGIGGNTQIWTLRGRASVPF
jgi:hypothetical protein